MEKLSHLLRMNWLKVPDVLYDILLFGGWIGLIVSAALLIRGIIRRQSGKAFCRAAGRAGGLAAGDSADHDGKDRGGDDVWRIGVSQGKAFPFPAAYGRFAVDWRRPPISRAAAGAPTCSRFFSLQKTSRSEAEAPEREEGGSMSDSGIKPCRQSQTAPSFP